MEKGFIVIDMPNNCWECECCITKNYAHSFGGEEYCGVTRQKVVDYFNSKTKPDWCPIKPLSKETEKLLVK